MTGRENWTPCLSCRAWVAEETRERAIQEGFAAGLLFGFVLGVIIAVAVTL